MFPHRVSLCGTCGSAGGPAGGCSGLDNVLLLGLLMNHLVIGWWGLSHGKERRSHTHTHTRIIFPHTIAFPLMAPVNVLGYFSNLLCIQL